MRANARALGERLMSKGYKLVTDGTDNHLVLWDLRTEVSSPCCRQPADGTAAFTNTRYRVNCAVHARQLKQLCNASRAGSLCALQSNTGSDVAHPMLQGVTGSKMESVCDLAHITLNKNAVVGDVSAMTPGGVRIGAPAMSSRGLVSGLQTFLCMADDLRPDVV